MWQMVKTVNPDVLLSMLNDMNVTPERIINYGEYFDRRRGRVGETVHVFLIYTEPKPKTRKKESES